MSKMDRPLNKLYYVGPVRRIEGDYFTLYSNFLDMNGMSNISTIENIWFDSNDMFFLLETVYIKSENTHCHKVIYKNKIGYIVFWRLGEYAE